METMEFRLFLNKSAKTCWSRLGGDCACTVRLDGTGWKQQPWWGDAARAMVFIETALDGFETFHLRVKDQWIRGRTCLLTPSFLVLQNSRDSLQGGLGAQLCGFATMLNPENEKEIRIRHRFNTSPLTLLSYE